MNSQEKEYILHDLMDKLLQQPVRGDEKDDFNAQSLPRRIFFAAWEMWESVVVFDGFGLYFHNKASKVKFTEEALAHLGATRAIEILHEATKLVFPDGFPETEDEIRAIAERVYFAADSGPVRGQLTQLGYDLSWDREDLPSLIYDFVLRHPHEFNLSIVH